MTRLWLFVVSFVFWCALIPHNALGTWSNFYADHSMHLSWARIFPTEGMEIWRLPINMLAHEEPELTGLWPDDVAEQANHGKILYPDLAILALNKPLFVNWEFNPRLYPPGDLIFAAPFAWLYDNTALSSATVLRMFVALHLAAAHIGLLFLWLAIRGRGKWAPVLFAVAYFDVVHWAMEGMFDVVFLAPMVLCFRSKGWVSLAWYCVAAFIHFRVYFLGPVALAAAWQAWQSRRIPLWPAVTVGFCGGWSLATFALVAPQMKGMVHGNMIHFGFPEFEPVVALGVDLMSVVVAFAFAWRHHLLDAVLVLFLAITFHLLPYAFEWYPLVMWPWVFSPGTRYQVGVRFAFMATLALSVCTTSLLPFWLLTGR